MQIMKKLSIRITNEQKEKLEKLSAKSGYSTSEILRKIIDNIDELNLKVQLNKIEDKKTTDLKLISNLKYQNYLLSNLTKNTNQIAHFINKYDDKKLKKSLEDYVKYATKK